MPVPDLHRTYLESIKALSRDDGGREVLVGLTFEETEELLALQFGPWNDEKSTEEIASDRRQEHALRQKHEQTRASALISVVKPD